MWSKGPAAWRGPFSFSRGRRCLIRAVCAAPLYCVASAVLGAAPIARDRIEFPPVRREFDSPGLRHRLVVETTDGWKTPQPSASLYRLDGAKPELRWTQRLPHHHGPRSTIVTDDGRVLLADEIINVNSRYALMLFSPDGRILATHDHRAVIAALGATAAEIAANSRLGTWMTDAPVLAADGRSARIAAGGRALLVTLESGRLSVER